MKNVRVSFDEEKLFERVMDEIGALGGRLAEEGCPLSVADRDWFGQTTTGVGTRVREVLCPVLRKGVVPEACCYDLQLPEGAAHAVADAVEKALVALYCEAWFVRQGFAFSADQAVAGLKHLLIRAEGKVERKNRK